ncbi:LptF/LptG family permease [Brytella acorum]|uniref:LptF/LptG family permease n=1 Tax=Brytella acorum TaxID=2959299 RepID=A0AA35UXF6_9PROT|nr:LptF/LptG family permease [Brytella acorum]MDF3625831.1 LptF/LptG family permease [Brytella acorum]CAI9121259.1 LptF/LptG family permease [Brytella acorum]
MTEPAEPQVTSARTAIARLSAIVAGYGTLRIRQFLRDCLRLGLFVMLLVEAVFLSERFPMVFRDVLRNHAGLPEALVVYVLTVPQIVDLSLPMALLVATYLALLQIRENRELLVLGAAGMGPRHLILPGMALAIATCVMSLVVSGVVNPLSLYAQRAVLFRAEYLALTVGRSAGQFYFANDRVMFAPPQMNDNSHLKRNIFIREPDGPGRFRVILAGSASVAKGEVNGYVPLQLGDVAWRVFCFDPSVTSCTADGGAATFSARTSDRTLVLSDVLPFAARGYDGEELTSAELAAGLMSKGHGVGHIAPDTLTRILGERVGRGLLCIMAPVLAFISVCLTTRRTVYLALPVACIVLMSFNISTEWIILALENDHVGLVMMVLLAFTTAGALALAALVLRLQDALFRPQLSRA